MATIKSFFDRLNKIGLKIEGFSNYPWLYMTKINGKPVKGTYQGNHGFTIFFQHIRPGEPDVMQDITTIFSKIRETIAL